MKNLVGVLILVLLATAAWFLYYHASFTELFVSDAMEYAEMGRNILRGQGFYAGSVFPIRFAYTTGFPFASVRRPFFLPFFESLVFRIFGPSDFSAAFSTGIFYVFLIPLIYALSMRLFNNRSVSVLSSVLFIFNGTALHYSISGLTEIPFAFFITLAFYFLVRRENMLFSLALGVALGASQLTRPNGILYLIPVLAALLVLENKGRKTISALLMLAGFTAAYLPLLIYNLKHTGNPVFSLFNYNLLMHTKFSPHDLDLFRGFEKTDVLKDVLSNIPMMAKKFVYGAYRLQNTFPQLLGRYFTAFFIISIFRYHKDRKIMALRILLYALIMIQLCFSAVTIYDIKYHTVFLPLMIIFSAEVLVYVTRERNPFLKRHSVFSNLVLIGALLFFLAPTGVQAARNMHKKFVLGENPGFCTPGDAYRKTGDMIKRDLPEGKYFVASDICWVSAWYGDRLSIKIPHRVGELAKIEKISGIPVKAVLVSTNGDYWGEYGDEWKEVIYNDRGIPGYKKIDGFSEGKYRVLLFLKE